MSSPTAGSGAVGELNPEYEISPQAAAAGLREGPGRLVLIDCRTEAEWAFAHVSGSVHIPLDELAIRTDEIDLPAGSTLAIICHHGKRSLRGALALREQGLHAMSVAGGIEAWSLRVDSSVRRYTRQGNVISPVA
ncbi:MAG: rhodanese-like domain-containing protein [Planctomycetota bacterium]|nr:rhodanese-like domain-containing protein [Planctomycetota bacterium]